MGLDRWDGLIVIGGLVVAAGVGTWSFAAGLIVLGAECAALGVLGARYSNAPRRGGA